MAATTDSISDTVGVDTPQGVLGAARELKRAANKAEVDLLMLAAGWAAQHSADSVAADGLSWTEQVIAVAGPGAPEVAEFCIAELATSLALSTDAGHRYLGEVVELRYRLPRLWASVCGGHLPAWKARMIARSTIPLPADGAAFVDAAVAFVAHRIGFTQLHRLIAEAKVRYDPAAAVADAKKRAESRRFDIETDQVAFDGTVAVEGHLDLADAIDLDAAITRGAQDLGRLGSAESLDVRRSQAAGDLARRQLTLDLNPEEVSEASLVEEGALAPVSKPTPGPGKQMRPVKPRQVVMYVHISEDALRARQVDGTDLARVENTTSFVSATQVAAWCGNPDTQVTVRPVIDLNDHVDVDAYEVPDRLAEQVRLANPTCVFPWCHRRSRRCDCDHIRPWDPGDPDDPDDPGDPGARTCTCNLAPLCRGHHRLKTHAGWTYTQLETGTFVWRSPHGFQYLHDHHGTLDVSRDTRPPPRPPRAPRPRHNPGHPPDS